MATSPGMAHRPLRAIGGSLLSIATGLRRGEDGPLDVLELVVEKVCRNAVQMLRAASPVLERLLTVAGPFAVLAFGIYKWIYSGLEIRDYVHKRFMADITVPGGTTLSKQLVDYMADHSAGTKTRSMTVLEGHSTKASVTSKNGSALMYIPKQSTHGWFRFSRCWLKISQNLPIPEPIDDESQKRYILAYGKRREPRNSKEGDVVVSAFSLTGSVDIIQHFLEHVHMINKEDVDIDVTKEPTQITRLARRRSSKTHPPGESPWGKPIYKDARDMSSVTMEAKTKISLLADMKKYIESRMWYHNRGIGWRRGYLLYGPPGTGKTSISTAIAGHFELPLYIISLSDNMSDDVLETAFDVLPVRCVVLMEDIDSAGIERDSMKIGKKSRQSRNKITLSGLLNAIDGPLAKEGRILIMTSNTPDSLDPALVRPGRIDRKILFGYACHEVAAKLFLHIFSEDDIDSGISKHDLDALSESFASNIPEDQLTPAEIQGLLLVHRDDPVMAVEMAASYAEDVIAIKRTGSNVTHFSGQVGEADSHTGDACKDGHPPSHLNEPQASKNTGLSQDQDCPATANSGLHGDGSGSESGSESESESGSEVEPEAVGHGIRVSRESFLRVMPRALHQRDQNASGSYTYAISAQSAEIDHIFLDVT